MTHYYNEFEPYAAQWLRNLISAGHLPAGEVDERSIVDVQPDDLRGFKQCHFFAGIGGWPLAARLAGWPEDRELWTGSAPCQPFSVAGKGGGAADDRHLWPDFFGLIDARRPAVVMGEQVAAAVGKHWLDGVFADLESIGYSCGAAVVPACAVNAPHRRDRLWFVADAKLDTDRCEIKTADHGASKADRSADRVSRRSDTHNAVALADTDNAERRSGLAGRDNADRAQTKRNESDGDAGKCSPSSLAYADLSSACEGRQQRSGEQRGASSNPLSRSAWDGAEWIIGHDGKARRVKSGIRLLSHGVPARVGKLRAYGNAIVPQVAAEVIAAFMDCRP